MPKFVTNASRGEYFSEKPIFLHTPKNCPARESRDTLVPGQYYFCTKPKKGNFSAHRNISARTPKKCYFYAQSNKKLAKSALYNFISMFCLHFHDFRDHLSYLIPIHVIESTCLCYA